MKNIYKIRISIAILVLIIAITGILGFFYPVKIFDIQIVPILQRVFVDFSITALITLGFVIVLTLLFGRLYCSLFCPLGIIQELAGLLFFNKKRTNKFIPNYPVKYFITAITIGILAGGSAIAIRYIEPYTYFGSAFTLSVTGLSAIVIILFLTFFKNRFFCSNICPAGTILGLLSKFSIFKTYIKKDSCVSCGMCEKNCPTGCINSKEKFVDNETCIKCFKCTGICPKNSITIGIPPKEEIKFNLKRREMITGISAAAIFGVMIKAGLVIKDKIVEKFKDIILPPGAESEERLANKCYNCNLCVENCPNKIIAKANKDFPTVHLDYSKGYCDKDCNKCGQVCPTGAIKRLSLEDKQKTRIGMAMILDDKCVKCGKCTKACPYGAIVKSDSGIIINASKCIGCGTCKHACHHDAIEIFAVKKQNLI